MVLIIPLLAFGALYTLLSRLLVHGVRVVISHRSPVVARPRPTATIDLRTLPVLSLATVHSMREHVAARAIPDEDELPRIHWVAASLEPDLAELPSVRWVAA